MKDTMDHTEVRELLEDAAIEPGGLERLMAGDTPTASIVAGHLAGCADCAEELERLRRSVGMIRPTVRAVPPPELKERTLAYVAALGRPRGAAAGVAPAQPSPAPLLVPRTTAPTPVAGAYRERSQVSRLAWSASLAAAVIVAVTGTALLVSANQASTSKALFAEVDALGDVARWTLRVDSQQDVRRVELASMTGTPASGSLVFSPTSMELVVVAEHLTPAAADQEYRCWVEVEGKRSSIGKMFFGGELAYWVGDVKLLAGLPSNARFGVSLVDLGTPGAAGVPVLASS
jgi:hypothetical protein